MGIPERVAERVRLASFFNEGDLILFGKYKNKRGRIVRMFLDDKGHPTIEVEPIPKGRKKNKIIGLYKIWHAPKDGGPSKVAYTMKDDGDDE